MLFLGILLGIKAMDYHLLTHAQDADEVKCELCTFALLNEVTPFDNVPSEPIVQGIPESPLSELLPAREPLFIEVPTYSALFGRPPPSLS